MSAPGSARLFVALDLPAAVRGALVAWTQEQRAAWRACVWSAPHPCT